MSSCVYKYNFSGYHGTDDQNVDSIQAENFLPSTADDDWLGHGVYFFVEGISCPIQNAVEWANYRAFDSKTRSLTYHKFAVLNAAVQANRVLDTTQQDGLIAFNALRNRLIQKNNTFFGRSRDLTQDNRILWTLVRNALDSEVVIHNLYIKDRLSRRLKIFSNVPNTTVMCVKDSSFIQLPSISVLQRGSVS
jgi:hypothetical protein